MRTFPQFRFDSEMEVGAAFSHGGSALGMLPVLALGRLSGALLYVVGPFDSLALTIALLILLTSAIFAGMGPASGAGRLDPASALRCE